MLPWRPQGENCECCRPVSPAGWQKQISISRAASVSHTGSDWGRGVLGTACALESV